MKKNNGNTKRSITAYVRELIRDYKKEHSQPVRVLYITLITCLTILFTYLIVNGKFTGELFRSVADIDTPELIDLYTISANNSGLKRKSDIVLMPIDGCSRHDVTNIIERLNQMPVAAVGVDVTFPYPESEDSLLWHAILSSDRIVMASRENGSYFEDAFIEQGIAFGSIRLDMNTRYDIVRSFVPAEINGADTIWSFEAQLMRMCGQEIDSAFPLHESSYIVYPRVQFDTIPALLLLDPLIDMESLADDLKGRIVILGDMESVEDMYRTPLQSDMSGMVIHAYVLNTLLQQRHIDSIPEYISWIIAFALCVIFSVLMLIYKWGGKDKEGLFLRITQFSLMVIVVIFGVLLFGYCDFYFDMEPIFLALAIQAVVLDITVGILAYIFKNNEDKMVCRDTQCPHRVTD